MRESFHALVRESFHVLVRESLHVLVRESFHVLVRESFHVLVRESFHVLVRESFHVLVRESFLAPMCWCENPFSHPSAKGIPSRSPPRGGTEKGFSVQRLSTFNLRKGKLCRN
ncbi:MAG: hypothetical protein V3W34_18050 [Phycisphaerae bacterium]